MLVPWAAADGGGDDAQLAAGGLEFVPPLVGDGLLCRVSASRRTAAPSVRAFCSGGRRGMVPST